MRIRGILLALALTVLPVSAAQSCAFHGYDPNPTLVDVLLGSEDIVVARPDPSTPGQFFIEETLLGQVGATHVTADVDAETQARLRADPDLLMLFVRDVTYAPWFTVAAIGPRYREIVEIVVKNHDAWGRRGNKDRFGLFAGLLNDPSAEIRALAFEELDRAEYAVLRKLRIGNVPLDIRKLEAVDPDLAPIRVLLAGLSGGNGVSPALSKGLHAAIASEVPHLGAYATALIELHGADGVSHIIKHYFGTSELAPDVREKLIEAFAIHSDVGARKTRRAIRRGLSDLLASDATLVGPIARQFGARNDWSLSEPLARAMQVQPGLTVNDLFSANQYLAIAPRK